MKIFQFITADGDYVDVKAWADYQLNSVLNENNVLLQTFGFSLTPKDIHQMRLFIETSQPGDICQNGLFALVRTQHASFDDLVNYERNIVVPWQEKPCVGCQSLGAHLDDCAQMAKLTVYLREISGE